MRPPMVDQEVAERGHTIHAAVPVGVDRPVEGGTVVELAEEQRSVPVEAVGSRGWQVEEGIHAHNMVMVEESRRVAES